MKYAGLRSALLAFVFIVAQLAGTLATSAKVRVQERTKYYNVSGKTGKQLMRSMSRRGPKLRRKGHVLATTKISVEVVNIKTRVKGRKCVTRRGDVRLKLVYTYPRWRNSKRASPRVRRAWKKFIAQMKKHETTHGRIAREYARNLHSQLYKATGRVSKKCRDFGKRSLRKVKRLQKQFDRKHDRFDRRESRASARIRRLQRVLVRSR